MTFDEYNTDEYFKNTESSADGLIKKAKEEGKTREEVESSLSPLWKEDKKGNVKKALDTYYKTEEKKEAPKKEPSADDAVGLKALGAINGGVAAPVSNPPEKKKEETPETKDEVVESVIEQTAPTKEDKVTLDKATEKYMSGNNDIADYQEDREYERQRDELFKRWDIRNKNVDKMSDSMRKIDDKLIDQLPTFMFKRYQKGEFGDPKSDDAKLRLAYFAINNVVSKFKQIANADAISRGKGAIFGDTESAYDKYQKTNLEQGLENRWNKYKQETQAAMDLAKQGGMSEEEITDSIAKISANNRLQSAFNQMNERQKVYALQVLSQVGDKIGNMNDAEFANTLMGMSAMGDSLDPKEAAGMLIYRLIKDPKKRDEALNSLGLLTGGMGGALGGGLGGILGGGKSEGDESGEETGMTLDDGTKIDPGKNMSKKELEELRKAAGDLGQKFYDGKLTEEEFRKEYTKLEGVMSQHGIRGAISGGIKSQDVYIKQIRTNKQTELTNALDALNAKAKAGQITPSKYEEEFNKYREQSVQWGASEKQLKAIDKDKVKNETILKAAEKEAKKKKK